MYVYTYTHGDGAVAGNFTSRNSQNPVLQRFIFICIHTWRSIATLYGKHDRMLTFVYMCEFPVTRAGVIRVGSKVSIFWDGDDVSYKGVVIET